MTSIERGDRLAELDVLRGFAVAVMILVVSPGSWEFTYEPLQHADWHGWNFADLVFPDFLFGVGMALGLTFGHSLDPARDRRAFWMKVGRRVLLLIALGLALNGLAVVAGWFGAPTGGPYGERTLRIPGVLQRIGLCYLIGVLVLLIAQRGRRGGMKGPRAGWIVGCVTAILLGYWLLLTFFPVPGLGTSSLDKATNLPAFVDRAVFTPRHMWELGAERWQGPVVYDPEGLLSTLPAAANVLCGVLAMSIWRSRPHDRMLWLGMIGALLTASALWIDSYFPINKKLWTSSFVLLTVGISCLLLTLAALLMMSRASRRLLEPLRILGTNALLAFTLSIFLSAIAAIPLPISSERPTPQQLGYQTVHAIISDPHLASLTCGLGILGAIMLAIWPLTRRGIYLRV